eukprot:1455310-Amphidinium_carterae.1
MEVDLPKPGTESRETQSTKVPTSKPLLLSSTRYMKSQRSQWHMPTLEQTLREPLTGMAVQVDFHWSNNGNKGADKVDVKSAMVSGACSRMARAK